MASVNPLSSNHVCVGAIAGAFGVRGGVRIKSFTANPEDVGAYGPLSDESGAPMFEATVTGVQKGVVLAMLTGITSRDDAEKLKGTRLYVPRTRLPAAEEDEFYHADLIGIEATLPDGSPFGRIVAVWEFGAGDSLDVKRPDGRSVMVPFTRTAVPVIDVSVGRVVIDPPAGLLDEAQTPPPNPPPQAGEDFLTPSPASAGEGRGGGAFAMPLVPR